MSSNYRGMLKFHYTSRKKETPNASLLNHFLEESRFLLLKPRQHRFEPFQILDPVNPFFAERLRPNLLQFDIFYNAFTLGFLTVSHFLFSPPFSLFLFDPVRLSKKIPR